MIKEEYGTLFAYKSCEKHMQHLIISPIGVAQGGG